MIVELALIIISYVLLWQLTIAHDKLEKQAALREFLRDHECMESQVSPGIYKCLEPTPNYWKVRDE